MMHFSAGSIKIGRKAQALAFLAESTSIFTGDKLLTMLNLGISEDHRLITALGLKARARIKNVMRGLVVKNFAPDLDRLKAMGRYRSLHLPAGIDFSSNDYLGLSTHPALRQAAIEALQGGIEIGATASRLLRGHRQAHEKLEYFAAYYIP